MHNEKKYIVFYHAYLDAHYKLLIQEQLEKLILSGLYEACSVVKMYITGPDKKGIEWVYKITKPFEKINVTHFDVDKTGLTNYREMKITLQHLANMAKNVPGYYCFFHTKSLTNYDYLKDLWRRSIEWNTICNWKRNIEMLDSGYDAVGPNYRENTFLGFHPHFAGAFWWTTDKHIKTLDYSYLTDTSNPFLEEFWIGSNHAGKYGSTWECDHEAPYMVESSIDKYINLNIIKP